VLCNTSAAGVNFDCKVRFAKTFFFTIKGKGLKGYAVSYPKQYYCSRCGAQNYECAVGDLKFVKGCQVQV